MPRAHVVGGGSDDAATAACPGNQFIVDGLSEMSKKARSSRKENLSLVLWRAAKSVARYPIPLTGSADAMQLSGVGKFVAGQIDQMIRKNGGTASATTSSTLPHAPRLRPCSAPEDAPAKVFAPRRHGSALRVRRAA